VIRDGVLFPFGGDANGRCTPAGTWEQLLHKGLMPRLLVICTILAGGILVTMGVARMGTMIKFIPYPVTMGFTSGIAVLIFSTQIKDFFGLRIDKVPSEFIEKMRVLGEHFGTAQWPTLILAEASLGLIVLWPKRWQRRVPGSIAALALGTLLVAWWNLPVETIGSKFGGIPQGLPRPHFPVLSWENIQHLFQPATTIALLAAIESLLCAVVADGMVDDRHDANQEQKLEAVRVELTHALDRVNDALRPPPGHWNHSGAPEARPHPVRTE
jgi:sulfate permease, SulP family